MSICHPLAINGVLTPIRWVGQWRSVQQITWSRPLSSLTNWPWLRKVVREGEGEEGSESGRVSEWEWDREGSRSLKNTTGRAFTCFFGFHSLTLFYTQTHTQSTTSLKLQISSHYKPHCRLMTHCVYSTRVGRKWALGLSRMIKKNPPY